MKLTYGTLNNQLFHAGMAKLERTPSLPIKTAVRVARLAQKLRDEGKIARQLVDGLMAKHGEMEETTVRGKIVSRPKRNDEGQPLLKDEDAWTREMEQLMAQEFEVNGSPLPLEDLAEVGLAPQEISALGPLIAAEDDHAGPQLVKDS